MSDVTWDPLSSGIEADSEIIASAQKRQIKNILKSYVGMYDPFSELLQNALDAVDRRKADEASDAFERKLWITVNLRENSFSVIDNGVGFKEKEFKSFLAPNISFKDGRKTRGNKGVGATYIAYGFDYLRFATKGDGFAFAGEIAGGRNWVDDDQGIVTRPVVKAAAATSQVFSSLDRGSAFTIKFGGANTRPKSLAWYQAVTAEQWLYLLLIRTPLGSIRFIEDDESPIQFDLEVVDLHGNSTRLNNQSASYLYPHLRIKASVDLKEVLELQAKLLSSGKDAGQLPAKYSRLNGLYEFFSSDDLLQVRNWATDVAAEAVIKEYGVEAYGYFSYSTSVWDQLNDVVAGLRKGYRVLRGGLQLANNRMIQGDLIVIPLTSNTGYQNQAHIIVHFRGADPDLNAKPGHPQIRVCKLNCVPAL